MKKSGLLFGYLLIAFFAFAQQNDAPYDFPVRPGSEKWQSFKTVEDMYAACQVPQDVLDKLSTAALIKTCLNYPAPSTLLIHNTPQEGFEDWKQHFNGIGTLLARADAREKMLEFYKGVDIKGYSGLKTEIEKGQYTFYIMMVESIMAQDEIAGKMSLTQKKQLLKLSLAKYDVIGSDPLYGFASLTSTGRIIVKLAGTLGGSILKMKIQTQPMQQFIATGLLTDRERFLQIIKETRTVATK